MQENSEQPDQVKKKLTKREQWLIGAVALLLVVIAGLLAYMLTRAKHGSTPTSQNAGQDKQSQVAQALKPEDVINKIKSDWQSKYKLVDFDSTDHPAQGELAIKLEKGAPDYNVTGYNFYVSYDGGSALDAKTYDPDPNDTSYPKKNISELHDGVIKIYNSLGLVETKTDATLFDTYIGDDLVCSVNARDTYFSSVSCGVIDSYTAPAEKLKPFAEAITTKSPTTYLGSPNIEDSRVNGYQKAILGIGDINFTVGSMTAYFYRKNSDPWTYFGKSQQGFLCSDYKTTDLKNAFKGDDCIDTNNNSSTVQ